MERSGIWRFLQMGVRIASTLFFDLRIIGARNVPWHGGVLIVANHQSFLDPVMLAVGLDRPMSFMARSGLFKNKYMAWVIRSLNAFPVEQGAGDVGAVKETIHRLQQGEVLNIFAEGSRSDDGEIARLEKGVGLVVRRAKVLIVPAVIDGAHRAWGKSQKLFHGAPISVMYGPPLDLAGLGRDEIIERIEKTLKTMLADLRAGKFVKNQPRERGR